MDKNYKVSNFSFSDHIVFSFRKLRRQQLSNMITSILNQNPELYYYQGFHDFVSVFLLTLGENLGYKCAEIASNHMIKDFMLSTFEQGVFPALDMTNKLLQLIDEDCW